MDSERVNGLDEWFLEQDEMWMNGWAEWMDEWMNSLDGKEKWTNRLVTDQLFTFSVSGFLFGVTFVAGPDAQVE